MSGEAPRGLELDVDLRARMMAKEAGKDQP